MKKQQPCNTEESIEDILVAQISRAAALFCATINSAGLGTEHGIVLKRARMYEEYILTGKKIEEGK